MIGDERKSVQEMELLAPVTPVKPMVPGQRQIYHNGQVILPTQDSSYMPRFAEENQDEVASVLSKMGNSSNQFEAGIVDEANRADRWTPPSYKPPTQMSESTSINESVHGRPPFSCGHNTRGEKNEAPKVKDTDPFMRYNHIPFCDLLAMTNGGNTSQIAMTNNVFLSDLNYQPSLMFDSQGIMGGAGNVLVEPYKTYGELQRSNLPEQDMLKQLSEKQSGLSRNCWKSYDLNALPNPENELLEEDRPTNILNAFPVLDGGGVPVCAPETPDHFKRLGNNAPGKTGFPADKQQAIDDQVSVPGIDNWLGINETQSSTYSIAIESFNPDEGGSHDIDQIKTPQPKPRRKKHRPKVIREVKPKQTAKQTKPKPSDASETPTTQKRKYVRKSDTNTPSKTPPTRGAGGSASKVPDSAVKSSRKSLNFDLEDRVKENSSARRSSSNPSSEQHLQNQKGKDVMEVMEATHEYDAYDISFRNNQILKDYMSMPEGKGQNESNSTIEHESRIKRDRRTTMGSNRYSAGSVHLSGSFANDGEQVRGAKRVNSSLAEASNMARRNFTSQSTPSQVNHMYLGNAIFSGMHGMYFPEIYKKRRTEKVLKPNTMHTLSCANTLENIGEATSSENYPREATKTSKYYYTTPAPRFSFTAEQSNLAATVVHSHQDKTHFMNWAEIDKLKKKKRSKVPVRVRDLDSLKGFAKCRETSRSMANQKLKHTGKKNVEAVSHPSSMGVLSIVSSAMRTGKRQSRKRSTKAKSITSSFDIVNQLSLDFHNAQQFAGNPKGPFLALPWKDTFSVDAVIEGMKQLNLNKEASSVRFKEQNILVPYHFQNHQQHALVVYQRDGTVIPFEGTQASKRRSRPKVELDDETSRVWKLLLEDINSQGIDGTDEEKAKWWENERKVFCGRVDSFIARMRLVQGDRHFSPWKGSVVDSVVGVFLTQNVSDHLSSSAFMSVAARFPVSSEDKVRMHSKEETSPLVEEPELCIIDLNDNSESLAWNEKSVEGPSCDRNSRTLHDADVHEEKEVVSSKESHGSTNLKDEAWCCVSSSQEKPDESLMYRASSISKESEIASASADARQIDDVESSQHSVISYQNSVESPNAPKSGEIGSNVSSGEDLTTPSNPSSLNCSGSFVELLRMAGIPKLDVACAPRNQVPSPDQEGIKDADKPTQKAFTPEMLDRFSIVQNKCSTVYQIHVTEGCNLQGVDEESRSADSTRSSEDFTTEQIKATESSVEIILHEKASESSLKPSPIVDNVCSYYVLEGEDMVIQTPRQPVGKQQDITNSQAEGSESSPKKGPNLPTLSGETVITESTCASNSTVHNEFTPTPPLSGQNDTSVETHHPLQTDTSKQTKGRTRKKASFDWESLRKQAQVNGISRQQTANTMDSVDWEAVRRADVHVLSETIKERGMNNVLAERIKEFLDRIVNDHGSINLEWLRDVPPDKAKEYLLSIRGLGLKSVECVRLLTLHQLAFPVDTNVGRIAVRLGWVPLQPLPESLQLHLLELYPILESIQKYLWPRLCKLDQKTLYELHYHLITFGKVFCTKKQPNCNACPLRGECRHFASAFASARLALPGPEDRSIVPSNESNMFHQDPRVTINPLPMPLLMADHMSQTKSDTRNCEPIVEIPASPEPEPEQLQMSEYDIEDALDEDPNEIPTIKLNLEQFTNTLQTYMQSNMELQGGDMSKALVALATEAASIPTPKLKNVNRLRTEHHVYELPDTHKLLRGLDKREPDDPCSYLLAIWTPGETASSIEHPEKRCNSQEPGELCSDETCFYCNNQREANSQIVRGTLLIPCRTAMRGSFPLNGTYFQVNEVFADHDSSLNPIEVPREWIWNLPRKTVYFGTSIPSIFKGLSTEGIQHCFWRGYVCVRGFDQKLRAPRPLMARLHFPASKLARPRGRNSEQDV